MCDCGCFPGEEGPDNRVFSGMFWAWWVWMWEVVEELSYHLPFKANCDECGEPVEESELLCPSCYEAYTSAQK